ncbi:uncharacterized protein LOC127248658 [Andrographis paniculata]|uniref:uncharacterized protein LOC127248658 n=1 Tax=Andrographis paniculata TaxID=175694 RepID=UPI0021E83207|nr:uncharacterized protein LOC127248658 [Andrographis paniculata]
MTSPRLSNAQRMADKPLYEGCVGETQLSIVIEMLRIKAQNNILDVAYDDLCKMSRRALPVGNNMPKDYYSTRKLTSDMGFPTLKIDSWVDGCMLFWKDKEQLDGYDCCGVSRWRTGSWCKKLPASQMIYLPLKPRIKQLYEFKETAHAMRWHATYSNQDGQMNHPCHGEVWKHFDRTHPDFSRNPRNLRFGQCTDGFAPFSTYGGNYSCWPVIF